MKRLVFVVVASGFAWGLLAGCHKWERPERVKSAKAPRPKVVVIRTNVVVAHRPPRPAPEAAPGSIKYLDFKNGFRDVVFGQKEASLTSLVLKRQDDARQLKTFTRVGEEMSLGGVPLESVEYNFFKGELYQIVIKWRIEQKDPAMQAPPAVTLAPFCASLYGPPKYHSLRKGGTELRWRGRRVELTLTETIIPGVPDRINGGWARAPAATGLMVSESIALRKAVTAMLASMGEYRKDGL